MSWATPSASSANPWESSAGAAGSSNEPAWMNQSAAAPPAPSPMAVQQQQGGVVNTPVDPGKAPKIVLYVRLVNLLVACLCVALSILQLLASLTAGSPNIASAVLCMYIFCFAGMICCFELQLKAFTRFIAGNFGFFFSASSRSLFLLFVSFLCFNLSILGIVMGSALAATSALNFYALCKYPHHIAPPAVSDAQKDALAANAKKQMFNAALKGAASDKGAFSNV